MPRAYAGIGSRDTPPEILALETAFAQRLQVQGFELRSGGARGSDIAFEHGAGDSKVIFYGNARHEQRKGVYGPIPQGKQHHLVEDGQLASAAERIMEWVLGPQHWGNICKSDFAKNLHRRNAFQILGPALNDPVEVVLYWAPVDNAGLVQGGTKSAVMLAQSLGIPTYNLLHQERHRTIERWIELGCPSRIESALNETRLRADRLFHEADTAVSASGIAVKHEERRVEQRVFSMRDVRRPPDCIYIGRTGKGVDGPYGNPYTVRDLGIALALKRYEDDVVRDDVLRTRLKTELAGKHLVCFCAPPDGKGLGPDDALRCHGQVILKAIRGDYEREHIKSTAPAPTQITTTTGDILASHAQAVVNPVNCVGVSGAGLALQMKQRYPKNHLAYAQACAQGSLQPGTLVTFDTGASPRFVINFPTKRHYRDSSRLEDIERGLHALVKEVRARRITSIAIPPLGCGLGRLSWDEVRPRIIDAFKNVPECSVFLFEPRDRSLGHNDIERER